MSARLDFCCCCGSWVAADDGTIRLGPDGDPEIICTDCLEIEQGRVVLVGHDTKNGNLYET